MDIGKVISRIRKNKGMKQYTLAEICGISATYLSQIEKNKKDPTLLTLKIISTALGIPLPILIYQSLTEDDIPDEKRDIFNHLQPTVDSMISNFS